MNSLFYEIVDDGYVTYGFTGLGYAIGIALGVLLLLSVSFFINKDGKGSISIKQLTTSALCLALAFVLSNVKLFKAPMGGSVTLLSMFFITYIGYLYGPRVSLTAAFTYGLLQLIVDPYIISFPQLLCDYIFAFTALGLAGFFYNKKNGMYIGYLVGIFGRFVFSVISGVIFFADYAPESMSPLLYSVLYNGSYITVEAIITIVVIAIPAVHSGLNRLKFELNEKTLKRSVTVS
ncbi:energy-coupled thiamine transporter ThiT [Butyrivibrio sp.]|uniref:energy-coupled thiamine transporter ThiT n=1 Tax=Butyrivibrio sp. TaxID=28121 RepID=UPI0025BEF182|nr:energy-coupled thiamine transporter ThiT [Butyrivibrio sp.]